VTAASSPLFLDASRPMPQFSSCSPNTATTELGARIQGQLTRLGLTHTAGAEGLPQQNAVIFASRYEFTTRAVSVPDEHACCAACSHLASLNVLGLLCVEHFDKLAELGWTHEGSLGGA
jgi:hypothetical protein